MEVEYKLTLYNVWHHLWSSLPVSVLYFWLVSRHEFSPYNYLPAVGYAIAMSPLLVIFLKYYIANRACVLVYHPEKDSITFTKRNKSISFTFDDIKKILRYKTPALAEERWFSIAPWDDFNYTYIILHNGTNIFISSLLIPDVDFPLDREKVHLTKAVFPYPWPFRENQQKESPEEAAPKIPEVFRRKVKEKSVEELQDIIANPGGFRKEFIQAAREELDKRQVGASGDEARATG